jgi:hypothetical protein
VDECLAFVLAIGFAVYGLRLFLLLRREGASLDQVRNNYAHFSFTQVICVCLQGTSAEARLFLVGAVLMLLLFLLRVGVFLWHFVTEVRECRPADSCADGVSRWQSVDLLFSHSHGASRRRVCRRRSSICLAICCPSCCRPRCTPL